MRNSATLMIDWPYISVSGICAFGVVQCFTDMRIRERFGTGIKLRKCSGWWSPHSWGKFSRGRRYVCLSSLPSWHVSYQTDSCVSLFYVVFLMETACFFSSTLCSFFPYLSHYVGKLLVQPGIVLTRHLRHLAIVS